MPFANVRSEWKAGLGNGTFSPAMEGRAIRPLLPLFVLLLIGCVTTPITGRHWTSSKRFLDLTINRRSTKSRLSGDGGKGARMKTLSGILLSLPLVICCSGVAFAADVGTIQVRNLTDKDAAISMDGVLVCTAKAHTDNVVSGTFCSFRANSGVHMIKVVYSDGKTDSGTVSFSDGDPGNVRVITLTK
jgi:hypothetical protein